MTTFTWAEPVAGRAVSKDGLADVIQTVHWRYRGTDENGISAETYGVTAIGDPNPEDFTPFDKVTASDVQGWLENLLDVPSMQANLQSQIDLIITPTTIIGPLYSAPAVQEVVVETTIQQEETIEKETILEQKATIEEEIIIEEPT